MQEASSIAQNGDKVTSTSSTTPKKVNGVGNSSMSPIFHIADKIVEEHSGENPFIALEFYPPRTEAAVTTLKKRMKRLKRLGNVQLLSILKIYIHFFV